MIEISEAIIRYKDTRTQAYDPLVVQGEIVGELVRCKDCKYWDNDDDANRCKHEYGGMWAKPNAYCSYAERKDERDCPNCTHHTEQGCTKWECEFERKETI